MFYVILFVVAQVCLYFLYKYFVQYWQKRQSNLAVERFIHHLETQEPDKCSEDEPKENENEADDTPSSVPQSQSTATMGSHANFLADPAIESSLTESRLPSMGKTLKVVAKLSKNFGAAGSLLGSVVDLVVGDNSRELSNISRQISQLSDAVMRQFNEQRAHINLQPFVTLCGKLETKLEQFDDLKRDHKQESEFYERVGMMIREYPPEKVIFDLKWMHNMIIGKSTLTDLPLFQKLAEHANYIEGQELDEFISKLFLQFQSILVLETSAVHMLQSFLVHAQQDAIFASDVKVIAKNIECQRKDYDPAAMFEWYIRFKINGGKFLISTVRWPKRYVYMQNLYSANVRGLKKLPGDQGIFTVKPHEGDTFLISPIEWPNWNIYMKKDREGDVVGYRGDPGKQGHWRITIKDITKRAFLLSTTKWPDWYVYMRDNTLTMNVRGHKGDPGPQGHFIFTPIDEANLSSYVTT